MTNRARAILLLCGIAPTCLVAALSLYRPAALAKLEYAAYDVVVRAVRTKPPDARVAIVDIDERSLSAIGQWPWRRDVVGRLISELRQLGAATIGLDIIFAESDRFESAGTSTDASLAEVLQSGHVVLGYALTFDPRSTQASACVQHPFNVALVRQGDDQSDDPFFRATGAVCSLSLLADAAGASGFLNAAPDPDGLLRRVPVLLELDGRVYPSLALAAVAKTTGARDAALRIANVNTTALQFDSRTVPLDGKSNLLVRYRGVKRTFPYISAADVLSRQLPPGSLNGKIVLVGTTALGTREVVATPLDTLFAGVEVQATVADNLLQQDFIHRPEHAVALETQIVLILGLLAALLVGRFGLTWGAVASAACVAALWFGAIAWVSGDGTYVSPFFPTLGALASIVSLGAARFALEHRRADRAVADHRSSQQLMIKSLLSLTSVRDVETGRHSRRTERYTRVLADQLARNPEYRGYLTAERIDLLATLAPLHDIGKVGVPDRLLNKPGDLTSEELAEMRRHPAHGRDVIVQAERLSGVTDDAILALAKEIVYTHHEKWDGSGYPEGLRGPGIPIPGRIIAVVDVYDAVRTRSLYRKPMSHEDAVKMIAAGRGTHFDPAVVDAFMQVSPLVRALSSEAEAEGELSASAAGHMG